MCQCADPNERQTIAYVEVVSTVVLLFDFCITFDSEVRWTWGRKWEIMRIAFVISRYLPIASVVMYLYYNVQSLQRGITAVAYSITSLQSSERLILLLAITTLGSAAADVLLIARTYAFCGGERRILIAISSFGMATMAAMLTVIIRVASRSGNPQCGAWEGQQSIIYGLHTIFQLAVTNPLLVLMFLTLYKHSKFHRAENGRLVTTIYRDGVFYMLCITLFSMLNWVAMLVHLLSFVRGFYGPGPQTVMRSVLASRILFNLRAANESKDVITNLPVAPRMVFARRIQTASCVDHLELWDNTD
ncbi:hypothetical protein BDR06DRAFT_996657, partial [Suillus hirtellus]